MRAAAVVVIALVCSTVLAGAPASRTLTFEDRVKAQTAIEHVYYLHQVGVTKKFEDAVAKTVVQSKVQKYLEQSAALSVFWKTAVTDQTLQRELERMAEGTRMPERLQELYAALGNDPFLVKECLARPALVDRLTRNFQALDSTLHVKEKTQADALHAQLVSGALNPSADNPNRTVIELVASGNKAARSPVEQPFQEQLTPEEFKKRRAEFPAHVGEVSVVRETRNAFTCSVVLSETKTELRVASYVIPKTMWDAWWAGAHLKVRGDSVVAVASGAADLPTPHQGRAMKPSATCADDYWDNGSLENVTPDPRESHLAVWTGSQMIVWGGSLYRFSTQQTGGRYDPATDTWSPTSLIGVPAGRANATAVWTGSQMVIWGGTQFYSTADALNTGARYDPVSDTWTPTTGRGAPSARQNHTAVWTGTRMVIWGGRVARSTSPYYLVTATGGQYDPATDSWTPTSVFGAPRARDEHTAVWTGSLMVIWGGNFSNTGGRYDPASDRWTPTSQDGAPRWRSQHSAVWAGTEMIIWGGETYEIGTPSCPQPNVCYSYVNTGGRYNPVSDSWTATSTTDAPTAHGEQTAVWTGSLMIVWGLGDNYELSNAGARYDPATDAWSPTSQIAAPDPREFHTAVWTGSSMLIWGGQSGYTITQRFPVNSGGRYDPVTDSWTPTDMTFAPKVYGPPAVWTGNLMLVWDGGIGAGARYDPVIDTWTAMSTPGAPPTRSVPTAVWTGTQMLVWGGYKDYGNEYPEAGGRYDPVLDSWSPMSETNVPAGRQAHSAVWTGSSMVIWGGYYLDSTHAEVDLDSGGRYDPATDLWTPTSQLGAPSARQEHTAVWTGSFMVVWGGGLGSRGYPQTGVNTGGRYDPTTDTWSPTSTTDAPSPRSGQTAVWTGSQMIVWGGRYDYGTGGRYDPSSDTWTPVSANAVLGGRYGHTAVWTGKLMVIWGGYGTDIPVYVRGSGGRYDPIADSWSPTSKPHQPEVRANHAAVWTGSSMIVWGGQFSNSYGGGGQYFPGTVSDNDCDGDGITTSAGDCDDHNPSVYPGAPQICDGINNDCSDPNWPYLPYDTTETDADGDGFLACRDDCNDLNNAVYPGAPQICDGVNDDCNDPAWPTVPADEADADGDGARICDGDCDDRDYTVGPGFTEYCDGRDNDCNGLKDDGGATASCDDYNPCTDDVCGGVIGCVHPANHNDCDDYNPCTSHDVCGGGTCTGTPTPGAACDDGNTCTTDDHCDNGGRCSGSSPCDDGDQCTYDYADTRNNCACSHSLAFYAPCDDGNPCTTGEYCQYGDGPPLICGSGWPSTCDDGNPCTDDSCSSPSIGCVHTPHDGGACSDGDPCTDSDTCQGGVCVGLAPTDCNAPCPAGSTAADGGCSLTYDIGPDALDNLEHSCDQDGLNRFNNCYLAYGFHWTDAGRALGPVIRVELALAPENDCTGDPSSVILNGTVIAGFVQSGSCFCLAVHRTVMLAASSVASYSTSGVNQIYVSSIRANCEGLSAAADLDGHFARVTVTYQRASSCETGTCDRSAAGCTYASRPDGVACTDGNACTVGDSCSSGSCGGSPVSDTTCDDGDACTGNDTCALGVCGGTPLTGNSCDDGNACTTNDTCVSGTCVGTTINCDDHNVCTDDSCSPTRGCVHANNNFFVCDDGDLCTSYDYCYGGVCIPGNQLNCDDHDYCTADSCSLGRCIHTNPCDDGNPCTTDTCDYWDGCSHTNNTDFCDDGNSCTHGDRCSGGTCQPGASSYCDDGDPCTQDSCAANGDCVHTGITGPCDDGDLCTTGKTCATGTCAGGVPVVCDDLNPCTTDTCNPFVGCMYAPNTDPCDDGSACTVGDHCFSGVCHGGTIDCDDRNPCTDDSCNVGTGCVHTNNAIPCSDGTVCTVDDRCSGGACVGTTVNCDDHNVCTTDSCDQAIGCIHIANTNSCDDGNACTTNDVCAPRLYFAESFDGVTAPALPAGWNSAVVGGTGTAWVTRATGSDTAPNSAFGVENDQVADSVLETPAIAIATPTANLTFRNRWSFDDADNCFDAGVLEIKIGAGSYADIVAAGGSFLSGGYTGTVSIDYGNPLANRSAWCGTSNGYPNYVTTAVSLPAAAAGQNIRLRWRLGSDSSASLAGQDIDSIVVSDSVITCSGGPARDCNDNNPCTDDSCNPATGCVHTNNTNLCSDSNACTSGDICGGGTCHGTPIVCNDNNVCTTDTCNSGTGCVYTNNSDACNDKNPCTDDTCDPATGCVHTNNTSSCDDGNACTSGDACGGGSCHGIGLNCDDGNPCTDDSCNPATGCVHTNTTNSCTDGNACTIGDSCSGGTCHAGTPIVCAPADTCHSAGTCNPATGTCSSVNAPDGTGCTDNNLCTTGDSCRAGVCTPTFNGLNHPRPKSAGYYEQLCDGSHGHGHATYHGEHLTDADALCVAGLTATFDYFRTVDDICNVLDDDNDNGWHGGRHRGCNGNGPNGHDCDKAENELIATALNICRARVCLAQDLDSHCHGNNHTTVAQSFADGDAVLDNASRDQHTCSAARCELREINNGHALEMNSLVLSIEHDKVRLTWEPPVMDDGARTPSYYELWRRPMGSGDDFIKIGQTTGLSFVDGAAGTAVWEYDVSAVMP